ncbi:unnamed protein product, partial [marine sediment metagenome]
MAKFEEIDKARKTLGLGESATFQEIKDAYRKLAHKYHPDKYKGTDCEKMFKEINNAYQLIMAYCAGYQFSFKKEDIKRTEP